MPEVIRYVLLCMLDVVEGRLCLLEAVEVMRRVLCMPEAVEGELRLLEMLWRLWRVGSFAVGAGDDAPFAGGGGRGGKFNVRDLDSAAAASS